jgi:carbon storage regulator
LAPDRHEGQSGIFTFSRSRTVLCLSRKKNESIVINDNVVVTVVEVRGDKVRIGIEAPRDVTVHRQEVLEAILGEKLKLASDRSEESCDSTAY